MKEHRVFSNIKSWSFIFSVVFVMTFVGIINVSASPVKIDIKGDNTEDIQKQLSDAFSKFDMGSGAETEDENMAEEPTEDEAMEDDAEPIAGESTVEDEAMEDDAEPMAGESTVEDESMVDDDEDVAVSGSRALGGSDTTEETTVDPEAEETMDLSENIDTEGIGEGVNVDASEFNTEETESSFKAGGKIKVSGTNAEAVMKTFLTLLAALFAAIMAAFASFMKKNEETEDTEDTEGMEDIGGLSALDPNATEEDEEPIDEEDEDPTDEVDEDTTEEEEDEEPLEGASTVDEDTTEEDEEPVEEEDEEPVEEEDEELVEEELVEEEDEEPVEGTSTVEEDDEEATQKDETQSISFSIDFTSDIALDDDSIDEPIEEPVDDEDVEDEEDTTEEEPVTDEDSVTDEEPAGAEIIEKEDGGYTLKINLNEGIESFIESIPEIVNLFNELPGIDEVK